MFSVIVVQMLSSSSADAPQTGTSRSSSIPTDLVTTLQQPQRSEAVSCVQAVASAFVLNPSARSFVPAPSGLQYADQYCPIAESISSRHADQFVPSSAFAQVSHAPDFGKVFVSGHLTEEEGLRTLVRAQEGDIRHGVNMSCADDAHSQFSRGTSAAAALPEGDGQHADGSPFDDDMATDYDEYEEGTHFGDYVEEEEEYGDDALTEEERAWLEAQCEAKDNPPDWFW